MNPFEELSRSIADVVKKALRLNFELQGHKLTGALESSIDDRVNVRINGATIEFLMFDYGVTLNNGVSAENIPYSRGSGAGSSKYIDGLKAYARLRFGVNDKEALSIAFAIANKHKKEGMPTNNSYKFSKNGKRLGAIDDAIEDSQSDIDKLISEAMEMYITRIFVKSVVQKKF